MGIRTLTTSLYGEDRPLIWKPVEMVYMAFGWSGIFLALTLFGLGPVAASDAAWIIAIGLPFSLAVCTAMLFSRGGTLEIGVVAVAFAALAALCFWLAPDLFWLGQSVGITTPLTWRFTFEFVVVGLIGSIAARD